MKATSGNWPEDVVTEGAVVGGCSDEEKWTGDGAYAGPTNMGAAIGAKL